MPGEPRPTDQGGGVMESNVARTMRSRDDQMRQREARYTGAVDIGDQPGAADQAIRRLGGENFNQTQYNRLSDETQADMAEQDESIDSMHFMLAQTQKLLAAESGNYDNALSRMDRGMDYGARCHQQWIDGGQPKLEDLINAGKKPGANAGEKSLAERAGVVSAFRDMMLNYELSLNAPTFDQTLDDYPELGGFYLVLIAKFGTPDTMGTNQTQELIDKCTKASETHRRYLQELAEKKQREEHQKEAGAAFVRLTEAFGPVDTTIGTYYSSDAGGHQREDLIDPESHKFSYQYYANVRTNRGREFVIDNIRGDRGFYKDNIEMWLDSLSKKDPPDDYQKVKDDLDLAMESDQFLLLQAAAKSTEGHTGAVYDITPTEWQQYDALTAMNEHFYLKPAQQHQEAPQPPAKPIRPLSSNGRTRF